MLLKDARLIYMDVETTGLSPAMGDRIVEIGMIACQGCREQVRWSQLINPQRDISPSAQAIHRIRPEDVADCPSFAQVAPKIAELLDGAWLVAHNASFDVGFVAMELMLAGVQANPAGCLDTCQLATAIWELPNYKLPTVARHLAIDTPDLHRAEIDAEISSRILARIVSELGTWATVRPEELVQLQRYPIRWPPGSDLKLPEPIYDALTNGQEIRIRYRNGTGKESHRVIQPVGYFGVGQHLYIRARCNLAKELRTFRLDRIDIEGSPTIRK
jgi:DNA polymerase III epsilon subunit family exonuclease